MNLVAVAANDLTGFVLLLCMLISSRVRRSGRSFELQLFSKIAVLTMISCAVDFFAFYYDGKPGAFPTFVNMAANTFCFISNPIFVASWCMYCDYKFYRSLDRIKKMYTYVFIPAILLVIIALVNVVYPLIFYIDASNVYHRLPLNYGYYIVDLLYLAYSVFTKIRFEQRYGKVRFFPMYLMMGPILFGCTIQACVYGLSLIWISLSIGITAIYMALQNEFSYLDPLTGLYNRAYLDYQFEAASKHTKSVLGGIMIDVDDFKQINDTYGHSVGDDALKAMAQILLAGKPERSVVLRFAGDEFIIIIKKTNEDEILGVMENLRKAQENFNRTSGAPYHLSFSMGYALYHPGKDTSDTFYKAMDDNMYIAKNEKHNRK